MPAISLYDRPALRNYFQARVPRPGWRPWFAAIDAIPEKLEVPVGGASVDVGPLGRILRRMTLGSRVRYAAYYWLYPFELDTPLEPGLDYLLRQAGLDRLDRRQVVGAITEACAALVRDRAEVASWVRARLALLSLDGAPVRGPALRETALLLRNQLLRVVNLLWQDGEMAFELANDLASQALSCAAQIVQGELGGESAGDLNASLMVPTTSPSRLARALESLGLPAATGEERARAIWQGLPARPETCLAVVAETVRHEHVGFWVPVVEGDGGTRLPGAPAAYANRTGSAVFRHDIPWLQGFGDAVNARWADHVRNRVRGRHFVSLPFVGVMDGGHREIVPAVININADPDAGSEWYRSLHREWLARARDAAAPFVELAFYAAQAQLAVAPEDDGEGPLLDIPSAQWRDLPGMALEAVGGDQDDAA